MDWWQAVILGIVEGVTEYLPVSSTGHLILAQRAMGIANSDAANAYAICIQGGAILAVLMLYWRHVRQMGMGVLGQDEAGRRLATNLCVSLSPLVGVVFLEKIIKGYLFGLWPVTAAWLVGGVAILIVEQRRRGQERPSQSGLGITDMTWRAALIIGVAQCIAVWPGTSRSLVTIVAGVLVGLSLPAAVEYSFLLGVATLGGATLKDTKDYGDLMVSEYGLGTMALGGFFCVFVRCCRGEVDGGVPEPARLGGFWVLPGGAGVGGGCVADWRCVDGFIRAVKVYPSGIRLPRGDDQDAQDCPAAGEPDPVNRIGTGISVRVLGLGR